MNPKLYECLEILGIGILKNESGTLRIFGNFGYGNFKSWIRNFANFCKFWVREFKKKMNPELCEFLEIVGMRILKNESETLRIFGNFGYGNFKN